MKKVFSILIVSMISVLAILPGISAAHSVHKTPISDGYNNQIISNYEFRAKDTMTLEQIQNFLASKGSALASYTITFNTGIGWNDAINANGMTAAQVIYNSAQWYSINPQVILATLEKESSLVRSGNLNNLNYAMGYACPETANCDPYYANFAKQIDGAAYQFYFNYKYSELRDTGRVAGYYAGNTANIDGKATYISNSATAALYRYTPHRPDSGWLTATNGSHYYGNYNFIYFYLSWFFPYDYRLVSAVNPAAGMTPNSTAFVQVHLQNTGGAVWYNEAEYNADPVNRRPMRLAVINEEGKTFFPNNDTWVDNSRIAMTSASVSSGQTGTFAFTIKAPQTVGAHTLKFVPVIEGVTAFQDTGMQFTTTVGYDYQFLAAVNPPQIMTTDKSTFVQVHLRNTGNSVWHNEAEYNADPVNRRPMRLAVINEEGKTFFPNNDTWVDNSRIAMTSSSVPPGGVGTFAFTLKSQDTAGIRTIKFLPVVEGIQALRDIGMQFTVNVVSYNYQFMSSVTPPIAMSPNQTATVDITINNTGTGTWYNEAQYSADPANRRPMRLAVVNDDGPNFFPNDNTWVDNVRVKMTTPTVSPGQNGAFTFTIKAPASIGVHSIKFVPIIEGEKSLNDMNMYFVTSVQ